MMLLYTLGFGHGLELGATLGLAEVLVHQGIQSPFLAKPDEAGEAVINNENVIQYQAFISNYARK